MWFSMREVGAAAISAATSVRSAFAEPPPRAARAANVVFQPYCCRCSRTTEGRLLARTCRSSCGPLARWPMVLKDAVNLHPRAAEGGSDGSRAIGRRVQSSDLIAVEAAFAAHVRAISLRPRDALTLTLRDE